MRFSLLLYLLLFSFPLPAQFDLLWQATIGGSADDYLWDLKPVSSDKAILAGRSQSPVSGDKTEACQGGMDYWIVAIEFWGQDGVEILWQKTIGGSGVDALTSIQLTPDGGFILAGDSNSPADGDKTEDSQGVTDFWVVKTDSQGQIEWQNDLGGAGFEYSPVIINTPGGGFLLGGYSNSDHSPDKSEDSQGGYDFWVLKLDDQGDIVWDQTIGGAGVDYLSWIDQATDGGYFLGGYSDSNAGGDKTEDSNGLFDIWVVKIDSLGQILWQNTIGGSDTDWLNTLIATPDGGCLLGGSSYSGSSGDKLEPNQGSGDLWLIKLDSLGQIEWQNSIGGDGQDAVRSIALNDLGYLVACSSTSGESGDKTVESFGSFDYWLLQVDSFGQVLWQAAFGGEKNDILLTVQPSGSSGYYLGGYSSSGVSGNKSEPNKGFNDYWVVYLDKYISTQDLAFRSSPIRAFPNPASDWLFFDPEVEFPVQLTDLQGRIIETWATGTTGGYSITHLPSGLYILREMRSGAHALLSVF